MQKKKNEKKVGVAHPLGQRYLAQLMHTVEKLKRRSLVKSLKNTEVLIASLQSLKSEV